MAAMAALAPSPSTATAVGLAAQRSSSSSRPTPAAATTTAAFGHTPSAQGKSRGSRSSSSSSSSSSSLEVSSCSSQRLVAGLGFQLSELLASSSSALSSSSSSPSSSLSSARRIPRRRSQGSAGAGGVSVVAASEPREVLIVNTNGGGHAVIGFHLAKALRSSGHGVTFLTVGEEASDKMKKPPFNRLAELREIGVATVWGDPSAVGAVVGSKQFDVVIDNNGKDMEAVQPVADWAKASGATQFLFVSSAGIYKTSDEPPHVEGDAVKESAGHAVVERYLASLFENWSSFRPQYITGSGNNKDCEEWFFDRIVRDRPVPIPGSGVQVTNIGFAPDMANMLALAVDKPEAASGIIFNCVSDRAVTFDGLVRLCAKAAGKEAKIVHYNPEAVGVEAKKAFPFRNMHFYAEPRAATEKLGWTPSGELGQILKERYQDYVASGRDKKDISFPIDDKIIEALKQPALAV
ncbi:hypothetical protein CBR_g28014 [Chara braunii]|uniref:NAD-dependent epimerase/dehydratase domain-containing protein n=1 Tax=Chara braunii TaxID=69332 RepID=A0A388L907_CHABU|nr:hypothetical protein CBR_g28014 [Chara braunii]|eukprot:GBG78791.1 hypothetical protein CBR_g28014 [Chara braunii]